MGNLILKKGMPYPRWVQRIAEEEARMQKMEIVTGYNVLCKSIHVHCQFVRLNSMQGPDVRNSAWRGNLLPLKDWAENRGVYFHEEENFLISFI